MKYAPWVTLLYTQNREQLSPHARDLTDQQYVLGMLRAVVAAVLDEDTTQIARTLLEIERGFAVDTSVEPSHFATFAARMYQSATLTARDYEFFTAWCQKILGDREISWTEAVEQVALDA